MASTILARIAAVIITVGFVAGCGESASKQNQAAYEACLKSAQADAKIAKATFAQFSEAKIGASTGEEEIRVNIPYELEGKKAIYQCIARKLNDGTFKVVF
jgi:outer membrane lipoprotein-sorting protein